jgi:hypothetical protein
MMDTHTHLEHGDCIVDCFARLLAAEVHDETHAARILLVGRVIETDGPWPPGALGNVLARDTSDNRLLR